MGRQVVVTGIGIVSPLGPTREMTWARLRDGAPGVVRVSLPTEDEPLRCLGAPAVLDSAYQHAVKSQQPAQSKVAQRDSSVRASTAPMLCHGHDEETETPVVPLRDSERQSAYAWQAAFEAIEDARIGGMFDPDEPNPRIGCSVSTSKGDLGSFAAAWRRRQDGLEPDPSHWLQFMPGSLAAAFAGRFGVGGPVSCPVAACATGIHSVIKGAEWILDGRCDLAIAGCADASLDALVIGSYSRMGVMAPSDRFPPGQAVRPFSKDRQGFAVGEGAAVFILEEAESARRRGAEAYAQLCGWATASDAFSMTDLTPDAQPLIRCIGAAMEKAELGADRIGSVNCHGTATIANDRYEATALKRIFGDRDIRCTANKSMIGHLLGASGGVELAVTLLSLRDQFIPPTINLDVPDPQCNLDFTPHVGVERRFSAALKVSLGFGGHLSAILAQKP